MFQRLFIWPLFAALMGFALGGSVFWAAYGPNTTIQQAAEAAEHHSVQGEAKTNKVETDEALAYYTLWLMVFTGILAFATIGMGAATIGLYLTGEKQIRHNVASAAAQSRDMERSMVAANRPWVKVDISVGGPIVYNANGANVTLRYVMRNIGRSPATNVMANPRLIAPIFNKDYSGNFDPRVELQKFIAELRNRPNMPFGFSLFPDETIVQDITVSMSNDEIKRATNLIATISPTIIGSVSYRMGFDDVIHQTGFIIEVRRDNAPRTFTSERNYYPGAIWVEEGDVPAEEVRLIRTFIDGGYAD
ncbi:hypothetical protein [Bradyrhizobium guangzhouense]|uniref:hypothetical protein n=1 Tax=Bradyrhizobium guangzhouense TaxID=1325095 RepID=UPI001009BFB2|nr:hypothetical protein [Bradyrhizobium guangzhouense]RXH15230.1 hypothetical protein EAS54_19330 [Bradyrhizobium guangzhouense]